MTNSYDNFRMQASGVRFFTPCDALREYVRYYYVLTADGPCRQLTFPIGCPQIIFHRKSPLFIPELGTRQSRFTISGQVNFPAHVENTDDLEMIVALFYPHTIGIFTDTPPSEFYNMEISWDDIGNRHLNDLAVRISDSPDASTAVGLLEQWLIAKIRKPQNLGRIGYAVRQLLHNPSVSVGNLAGDVSLSRKQFERLFREYVGMNPKEYARIARFQQTLRMMQLGSRDYVGIACAAGYADQSHFIREFRQFSGLTPRRLIEQQTPYSDLYTSPLSFP